MNNKELIERVATRLGMPKAQVARVLGSMVDTIQDCVASGEQVAISGLGRIQVRQSGARTIRSVVDMRKVLVGPKHNVRFVAAAALKASVARLDDPSWSDPAVQGAWRTAETLVGDLDLYHKAKAPQALDASLGDEVVIDACNQAFGGLWRQVEQTFAERVPAEVRGRTDLLAAAARRRWAASA
jgi:nucleoid DNA-binding protein